MRRLSGTWVGTVLGGVVGHGTALGLVVTTACSGTSGTAARPPPEGAWGGVPWREVAQLPVEPLGPNCLSDERARRSVESLRHDDVVARGSSSPELVGASCHKRQYVEGDRRYVVWETGSFTHAKGSSTDTLLPTPACIERGLARAREVLPLAGRIVDRAAQVDPTLWRDPDVGMVAYLRCDRADRPDLEHISTMLHETVHHLGRGGCIFEYSTGRDLCFEASAELPPGLLGAYPAPPPELDADARAWAAHLHQTYLVNNGQGVWELLDEVTAYRIEADLGAAVGHRQSDYLNLPMLMALVVRYLDRLALEQPALAAREFGRAGRHRGLVTQLLDLGAASYQRWSARHQPVAFEHWFWSDYLATRARWEAR